MTLVLPAGSDAPWYDFEATLEGSTYRFELRWNARSGAWFLTLHDAAGEVITAGRRVVLGASLLGRSADARLPRGTLLAIDTSGTDEEAGREDLGGRVKLVYVEAGA